MLNLSQRSKLAVLSQVALAAYWLVLFIATHLPAGTRYLPRQNVDKVDHFFGYALLALLIVTTWQLVAGYLTTRHLCWAWVAIVFYGAIDEITQIPVGRECSLWDWLADAVGAVLGLLIFVGLRRIAAQMQKH